MLFDDQPMGPGAGDDTQGAPSAPAEGGDQPASAPEEGAAAGGDEKSGAPAQM